MMGHFVCGWLPGQTPTLLGMIVCRMLPVLCGYRTPANELSRAGLSFDDMCLLKVFRLTFHGCLYNGWAHALLLLGMESNLRVPFCLSLQVHSNFCYKL